MKLISWFSGLPKKTKILASIFASIAIICVGVDIAIILSLPHRHKFAETITFPTCNQHGYTTHTCKCGYDYIDSYTNILAHNFENYVYDNNATCSQNGTETAICNNDNCTQTNTREKLNTMIEHTYNVTRAYKKYLKSAATCTNSAVYYLSCECGAIGTETFEYGTIQPHSYDTEIIDVEATCTEDGSKRATCSICNITNTLTIPAKGHDYISFKCSTCNTYSVELCRIGMLYHTENNLSIVLTSFTLKEHTGYYEYEISYTVTNNEPNTKIFVPLDFELFFTDGDSHINYGSLGRYFYYGETAKWSSTFKIFKNQTALILNYKNLYWLAPTI